jgi:3-dehydroquinate dehydratase-1
MRGRFIAKDGEIRVVGSIGSAGALAVVDGARVASCCDIVEIRLDSICGVNGLIEPSQWSHLREMPLLFTARRREEGGAGCFNEASRMAMLETCLTDAAVVDLEVASIAGMKAIVDKLENTGVPWVASFHDFVKTPSTAELAERLDEAKRAGAAVFKAAAMLQNTADLARLAEFQLADHGIPVSTMGMGPLAPVSRLLCAQYGSVLNYGYIGDAPTAPGQWDAAMLKAAISGLIPVRR